LMWVTATFPPRARRRWLLMTIRLSISSLTGTERTLVAVGTVSEASMLIAVRAAAPRRRTCSTSVVDDDRSERTGWSLGTGRAVGSCLTCGSGLAGGVGAGAVGAGATGLVGVGVALRAAGAAGLAFVLFVAFGCPVGELSPRSRKKASHSLSTESGSSR